ncbi:MAG: exopolysaccharide biosynthesis polyprenyl glycosylphosphotransferase [Rhodobacteraceae bacterium]|nr:exopolysaccharide biosynthesis polyprenyl glycosylphosphotransferase [Paracoccaceae bacterium]
MTLATERAGGEGYRPDDISEPAARAAHHLRRPSLAPAWIAFAAILIDAILFSLATWFAEYAATPNDTFRPWTVAVHGLIAGAVAVCTAKALGAYRIERMRQVVPSILRGMIAYGCAAFLAEVVAPPQALALETLFILLVTAVVFVAPSRLAFASVVNWAIESGLTQRRAVIYGGGPEAEKVLRAISSRPNDDIRVHAVFDDRGNPRVADLALEVPKIGRFADLVGFCRRAEIDMILITLPPTADRRIANLLDRLRVLPVPVHLTAFSSDYSFRDDRGSISTLIPASFRPERRIAKLCFDVAIGSLLLILLSPVMLGAAIAIRLDSPGPVLFRQLRHGFNNRPVRIWKFRTMYADQCDPAARNIVTRDDPRVTRVGRFLRKSSIDELPQLFNVLSGTLSLVGPRPHALDARSSRRVAFEKIVDGYSARHRLPPGITGWAQINGWRGEVSDPEALRARVEHDLFYIENWSLWFDLTILLRTPFSLLDTRRAY